MINHEQNLNFQMLLLEKEEVKSQTEKKTFRRRHSQRGGVDI